ncbi:hypothetical protein, partial [Dokdonella soli]|uniref:hypothetical protein n=1 Tax=Dokdonella soli TaxID=529810 RepID=UPI0036227D1F
MDANKVADFHIENLTVSEREKLLKLATDRKLKRLADNREIIVRAPDEARSALSFAQQRLWFLDQLDEASQAYHIAMGLRLAG